MEKTGKKICWSRVLKNISYFLAPVLLVILMLSILTVAYPYEKESLEQGKDYFYSIDFANSYVNSIENYLRQIAIINSESIRMKAPIETQALDYGYYSSYIVGGETNDKDLKVCYKYRHANFCYLIIDHKNNIAYTNLENRIDTNTVESIKSYILSHNLNWKYENKEIDTSIQQLKKAVNEKTSIYREYLRDGEYTVYTCVLDGLPYYDEYFSGYWLYTIILNGKASAIYVIPFTLILLIIMVPIVLIGIGKTRKDDEIHLNFLDKWSLGIVAFLAIMIAMFGFGICAIGLDWSLLSIAFMGVGLIIAYLACIMLLETIVKRLKTHTFIETTFIYWCYAKMKQIISNIKVTIRIGIAFAGFVIANWILFASGESFVGFMLTMGLYAFSFIYILKRVIWFEKIKNTLEEIYKRKYKY